MRLHGVLYDMDRIEEEANREEEEEIEPVGQEIEIAEEDVETKIGELKQQLDATQLNIPQNE